HIPERIEGDTDGRGEDDAADRDEITSHETREGSERGAGTQAASGPVAVEDTEALARESIHTCGRGPCTADRGVAMRVWEFLKETVKEVSKDRAPRMGAALAYYTTFSLAPVLVIAIGVAGIFFGQRMAEGRLMDEIRGLVGPEGAGAIRAMIENAAKDRSGGVLATMIGVAALIFGATGAFVELQDALNTIFEAKPRSRGLLGMLKDRVLSFTLVVGIGFLLLVSLVISAALAALGAVTSRYPS